MNLPVFIARRYLFAKKTHNVINIISYISVVGVAIGTFALIVVLSVYNGFDSLIRSLYTAFDPDIRITAVEGKTFIPDSVALDKIKNINGVIAYSQSLEENALISYKQDERYSPSATTQYVATMKGVDSNFVKISPLSITRKTRLSADGYTDTINPYIINGYFELWRDSVPSTVVGIGVAQTLGVNPAYLTPLQVWIPKRGVKISTSNPAEALSTAFVYPSGLFSIEKSFDDSYFFVPIEFARNLLKYDKEISSIEIKVDSTANLQNIQQQISEIIGDKYKVRNRYQQNETLFRMMSSEKYAIYLILIFIIIIVSFNIIGSISMLIVDKKKDISTLQTIGADQKTIKKIFFYEGLMIAFGGAIIGLTLGLAVCFVQKYFQIIKLPNTFIVGAYPVEIQFLDVFLVLVFVLAIGYVMARLPIWYLSKKFK